MGEIRYRVPSFRGWRPMPGIKDAWSLPLRPANRDTPERTWDRRCGEAHQCFADIWPAGVGRLLLWSLTHSAAGYYRGGYCASLAVAKRRAELAARVGGLRPSRYVEEMERHGRERRPVLRRERLVSPSWRADPIFWLVLANDPAEVAARQAEVGMDQAAAVDWFMGTCWGDAPSCWQVERKPFCSDADRLAALRVAFALEGIS